MSYRSVFKPGLFDGQTVIVTGGGSGIGRCTAHEIAALGAHVVITGRKPDKLAAVKAEIEASGGSCETHAFDIREEAQVKEAIAEIVAGRGRIHGLFNNAGGQFPSPPPPSAPRASTWWCATTSPAASSSAARSSRSRWNSTAARSST